MFRYKTVACEAEAEQTIEKSKFIAHVKPVRSKEEADAYLKEIRRKYRDATHNVPALVLGEKQELVWASDDGEPQGTSGPPVAQLLVREGLTNLMVVITRYFGGIKLGPGGLVRAYTGSAALVLDAAGICDVCDRIAFSVCMDYTFLAKIQSLERSAAFQIRDIAYADKVSAEILCAPENEKEITKLFCDHTGGSCVISRRREELACVPQSDLNR